MADEYTPQKKSDADLMALVHADGGCDNCSSHAGEMIRTHLGEVTTELDMRFCCPECRDMYVTEMLISPKIDHSHKAELLESFPHLIARQQDRIEGPMGTSKLQQQHHNATHKKAPATTPTVQTKTADPTVNASLLTSLKRKVSSKFVADPNRVASILVDMANYFGDKLDTSEDQILANGKVVMAATIGLIASNGYPDTDRAKSILTGKWIDALVLAGKSQDFFPSDVVRSKKVIEVPSIKNKELATELAMIFSADSDQRKTPDINHLALTNHINQVVAAVIRSAGESGYLFMMMFPIDVRVSTQRTKAVLVEESK